MLIEDDREKPREDDAQETPEWHRARAKQLRNNGFEKVAKQRKVGKGSMFTLRLPGGAERH